MTDSDQDIRQELSKLVDNRLSLELATASENNIPCASYAPYVCGENLRLYVFLSDLAKHTANIRSNPHVSAMIIEDESKSPNLFARNRLVLECKAEKIYRGTEEFDRRIGMYSERFGAIVDTLLQLADFNLYVLIPDQGVFVKGFGQAYQISGDLMSEVKHITNPARQTDPNN